MRGKCGEVGADGTVGKVGDLGRLHKLDTADELGVSQSSSAFVADLGGRAPSGKEAGGRDKVCDPGERAKGNGWVGGVDGRGASGVEFPG